MHTFSCVTTGLGLLKAQPRLYYYTLQLVGVMAILCYNRWNKQIVIGKEKIS